MGSVVPRLLNDGFWAWMLNSTRALGDRRKRELINEREKQRETDMGSTKRKGACGRRSKARHPIKSREDHVHYFVNNVPSTKKKL